jgi:hypothetical protein
MKNFPKEFMSLMIKNQKAFEDDFCKAVFMARALKNSTYTTL